MNREFILQTFLHKSRDDKMDGSGNGSKWVWVEQGHMLVPGETGPVG